MNVHCYVILLECIIEIQDCVGFNVKGLCIVTDINQCFISNPETFCPPECLRFGGK